MACTTVVHLVHSYNGVKIVNTCLQHCSQKNDSFPEIKENHFTTLRTILTSIMKLDRVFTFACLATPTAGFTLDEQHDHEPISDSSSSENKVIWSEPLGTALRSVKSSGSGCPQDAVRIHGQSDPGVTFSTTKLFSITGDHESITDSRKFCQFVLTFDVEPEYELALDRVSIQSYVALNDKITAKIAASHYFSGEPDTVCIVPLRVYIDI
jgi:hypothetical protein